ncbi:MAG TPA: fumarylacetoacetate hydrolase family protein [Silvibacterium sp.]|nr:fumarylacetoacetate hydrolase family protein [Silvibacterium sp.]
MATSAAEHQVTAFDNDRMYQAAEILLKARREVMPIHELPEKLRPHSLEEAYALQDIVAEAIGMMGGWKVGAPTPDATPVVSPMPLWGGFAKSGTRMAASFKRLRGVEAEVAFCLSKDLPLRAKRYAREEVADAIGSAHPAIELLESAYFEIEKVDRLSLLGDMLCNGGFVYGAAVPDWQKLDLAAESVKVTVDGAVRFEGKSSNPGGTDLLRLVTWLANEGSYRTGGLKFGQWITTGTWSGVTYAKAGSTAEVRFSRFGEVRVNFE